MLNYKERKLSGVIKMKGFEKQPVDIIRDHQQNYRAGQKIEQLFIFSCKLNAYPRIFVSK